MRQKTIAMATSTTSPRTTHAFMMVLSIVTAARVSGALDVPDGLCVRHGCDRRGRTVADPNTGLDGIGGRVARWKRFFECFVELQIRSHD